MGLRVALTLAAVSLVAAPGVARDRTGYQAISAGDLGGAEQVLVAERRIFPDRPELMLNLASVYDRTDRDADAAALYSAVLARPDVAMDMPGGKVMSSHELAQAGLARTAGTTVASR